MSDKRKSNTERVEEFIQKIRDLDLVIDERASTIMLTKFEMGSKPSQRSLADILALMMDNFVNETDTGYTELVASLGASWIDKVYFHEVIKEGEGLNRKLKECLADKLQKEKELEQIAERNLELEFKCNELQSKLDQLESTQRIFKDLNK